MWIFLNDAWLSIVEDREDAEYLLVRSRRSGDIERVFGVQEDIDREADYHYRAHILRDHVAGVLAREVGRIDYDNFKNSVEDSQLHASYSRVWQVGYNLQWANYNEGRQRRLPHAIVTSSQAADDLDVCAFCQEDIDIAFHAPEPGQPVDVCEACWSDNGKEVLNRWYSDLEAQDQAQDEEEGEQTKIW